MDVNLLGDTTTIVEDSMRSQAINRQEVVRISAGVAQPPAQSPQCAVLPVHDLYHRSSRIFNERPLDCGQQRQHDHHMERLLVHVRPDHAPIQSLGHTVAHGLVAIHARNEKLVLDVDEALRILKQVAIRRMCGGLRPCAGTPAAHRAHHLHDALLESPFRWRPTTILRLRRPIQHLVVADRNLPLKHSRGVAGVLRALLLRMVPTLDAMPSNITSRATEKNALDVLPRHPGLRTAIKHVCIGTDVDEVFDPRVRVILAIEHGLR
mmetsp:Transcript_26366/g.87392  ORF Transcript_26366/g.87392 Transcript_26366/m.87392 type:complete len:265 (+) Transcript_26366:752-1546(+)